MENKLGGRFSFENDRMWFIPVIPTELLSLTSRVWNDSFIRRVTSTAIGDLRRVL